MNKTHMSLQEGHLPAHTGLELHDVPSYETWRETSEVTETTGPMQLHLTGCKRANAGLGGGESDILSPVRKDILICIRAMEKPSTILNHESHFPDVEGDLGDVYPNHTVMSVCVTHLTSPPLN